ncbi:MAG: hypothetical protein V7784_15035 [Oceanospirillaceae bacterium]
MKLPRTKVAEFQNLACELTLPEALAEFYAVNSHIFSTPEPNTVWTKLLVHHDVCHVFFGVNTSVLDETAGDYWTLFGTSLSVKEYSAYAKSPEGKKLLHGIGFINMIKSLFLGIALLVEKRAHLR